MFTHILLWLNCCLFAGLPSLEGNDDGLFRVFPEPWRFTCSCSEKPLGGNSSSLLWNPLRMTCPVCGMETDAPYGPPNETDFSDGCPPKMPGRQEEATFATDLFDVFEMIRRESPVLFEKLNREDRVELILKVMRALDTGVTPLNEETMAAELKGFLNDAVHDKIYPARTIADNRILYCRMDSLDDASLKQLEEDLLATGRLTRKPVGSILDLRDATGSDARIAGHIAQLFSDVSADAEDSAELPAELLHFRRIPVIVMTSSGTSGSPELAAALIDCTLHGISIGQTGVGRPFQTKRANAANHVWLVPDILFSQQGISPYATPPAIPIPESIQQKAARVGISSDTDPFGTGKDSMLAYAIDLVLSLHAMRELKNGK